MTTLNIPLVTDEETIALIFDRETGEVHDECSGLESAINYALYESQDYLILAVAPVYWYDGTVRLTMAELQSTIDREAGLWSDCFNKPIPAHAEF